MTHQNQKKNKTDWRNEDMEFSTNQVLSIGLVAFLAFTLIFTPTSGLTAHATTAQTKATSKIDSVVTSYQ
jgi:hypothetical protein